MPSLAAAVSAGGVVVSAAGAAAVSAGVASSASWPLHAYIDSCAPPRNSAAATGVMRKDSSDFIAFS
jgi:hypothetical protein